MDTNKGFHYDIPCKDGRTFSLKIISMRIVTEIYDDDEILRNRIEEHFCDKCGYTVESKNHLFSCVRYVLVKNPNPTIDEFFGNAFKIGEDKFKCCLECLNKFKNNNEG